MTERETTNDLFVCNFFWSSDRENAEQIFLYAKNCKKFILILQSLFKDAGQIFRINAAYDSGRYV